MVQLLAQSSLNTTHFDQAKAITMQAAMGWIERDKQSLPVCMQASVHEE